MVLFSQTLNVQKLINQLELSLPNEENEEGTSWCDSELNLTDRKD